MCPHKKVFLFFVLVSLCARAFSDEKPWREIRSPHFRVITNGSERSGRHVARAFEQLRAVFAAEFPGYRLDSAAPFLILAPEDEYTTKKLLPEYWKHRGPKPAGVYITRWEKRFAVVRLDAIREDNFNQDEFAVVYHEYVHSLLHMNLHWLPTWLDEGLAQFYAFTRFEGKRIHRCAPQKQVRAGGAAKADHHGLGEVIGSEGFVHA